MKLCATHFGKGNRSFVAGNEIQAPISLRISRKPRLFCCGPKDRSLASSFGTRLKSRKRGLGTEEQAEQVPSDMSDEQISARSMYILLRSSCSNHIMEAELSGTKYHFLNASVPSRANEELRAW
jgi:hypothetical protein